jgi:putative acetyltransferase
VIIRDEASEDGSAIHALVAVAFGRPDEADLVDRLRAGGDSALSRVTVDAGAIVGHVLFSSLRAPFPCLALAPVSVLPPRQRAGIGSALIRDALARARLGPWQAVFVLGNPAYYRRFGFDADLARGFASPYSGPHFMAVALRGSLPVSQGQIAHAPAFAQLG